MRERATTKLRLPPVLPILDAGVLGWEAEGSADGSRDETDSSSRFRRETEALLRALRDGGASWVEYRDKAAGDRRFHARALALAEVARRLGLRLLVNDRVDVAAAVRAAGVHLGQDDLPPSVARELLGPAAVIGLSTGGEAEACEAAREPVDYVAYGPVYTTATKPDAGDAVGLDRLAAVRAATSLPLVAVGGIAAANAAAVASAGADCVAVASSLLRAEDAGRAMRRLLEAALEGLRQRGVRD